VTTARPAAGSCRAPQTWGRAEPRPHRPHPLPSAREVLIFMGHHGTQPDHPHIIGSLTRLTQGNLSAAPANYAAEPWCSMTRTPMRGLSSPLELGGICAPLRSHSAAPECRLSLRSWSTWLIGARRLVRVFFTISLRQSARRPPGAVGRRITRHLARRAVRRVGRAGILQIQRFRLLRI
jgi:hypothetical protein